jgi:hypothetical protein
VRKRQQAPKLQEVVFAQPPNGERNFYLYREKELRVRVSVGLAATLRTCAYHQRYAMRPQQREQGIHAAAKRVECGKSGMKKRGHININILNLSSKCDAIRCAKKGYMLK